MMKYSNRLRFQFEDLKAIEHELEQENQSIVNCWLQATLFLDNDGKQDAAVKNVMSYLETKGLWLRGRSLHRDALLIEMLPMCHGYDPQIRGCCSAKRSSPPYLACVAPIYGPWKAIAPTLFWWAIPARGSSSPLTLQDQRLLQHRHRGPPGAGKSVLAGNLVKQLLTTGVPGRPMSQDGGQVFVIDLGLLQGAGQPVPLQPVH